MFLTKSQYNYREVILVNYGCKNDLYNSPKGLWAGNHRV